MISNEKIMTHEIRSVRVRVTYRAARRRGARAQGARGARAEAQARAESARERARHAAARDARSLLPNALPRACASAFPPVAGDCSI